MFAKLFKDRTLLFLLTVIFIFASPLVFIGFHQNHDSITHLARAAQYVLAIKDGQFPPRWAPTSNYGFGSPFFILYYPLSGVIMAILYLVGLNLEYSYILFSFFVFFVGPISFYYLVKTNFDKKIAFFSSIVYLFLPYRYLTLYVRGGVGEFLAFSLIPLLFLLQEKKRPVLTGIIFALIVLSHNAIALLTLPLFLAYFFLKDKTFFKPLLPLLIGLSLSAYFWIPALFENKYTQFLYYFGNMYKEHFTKIPSLLYSPWGFGTDVNKMGGLSPQIGILAFIILVSSFAYLFKKKLRQKPIIVFWILIFLTGIFLSTSVSTPFWQAFDFLKRFQFPWRFTILSSLSAVMLAPYVFKNLNEKIVITLLIVFGVFSLQFIQLPKRVHNPDSYYFSYPGSTYFHGEGTTIWTQGDPFKPAKNQIELIGGEARIYGLNKKTTRHNFIVDAKTKTSILDNTIYYPGWKVYVNGYATPIEFQDVNHKGFITFNTPAGKNDVKVVFEETKMRLISDIITLASVLLVGVYFLKKLIKR